MRLQRGAGGEGLEGGTDHLGPGQHVAGDRDEGGVRSPHQVTQCLPVQAAVRPVRIDGVDLAQVAALVGGERALDGRGGLHALLP